MIELGPCEITGVFGPMASGKTHLINTWLRSSHSLSNRYTRFDVTGETIEMEGMEHIWMSPKDLYLRLKANPYYFRIAYHCGPKATVDFEHVIRAMVHTDVYKLLVVDEFHEVCAEDYVGTLVRYARHARIAIIAASQRFPDVPKLFVAGCRQVIVYTSDEYRDYVAVGSRWGKEVADAWRNMRPLIYDDVKKITYQVPQCLVAMRGKRPRIYDFATDQYSEIQGTPERQLPGHSERDSSDDPDSSVEDGEKGIGESSEEIQRQSGSGDTGTESQ